MQISHIVRKRSRSKSPSNYIGKNRSPRRRLSPLKRPSPKYSEMDRNKRRPFKYNGGSNNRDRLSRQNDFKERRVDHASPRKSDKEKLEDGSDDGSKYEKPESLQTSLPVKENSSSEAKVKREKTEEELEDELLASTDSEGSVKGDDDEFKVMLDEKELDFLDDEEDESENEGRFKSKTSSSNEQKKPTTTANSFKSSYPGRSYDKFSDKPRNYGGDKNGQRGDYRRSKYSDKDGSKRDKKRSRSPFDTAEKRGKDEKHCGSPIRKRKSPEPVQKATKEATKPLKVTTSSKDKPEAVKDEPKKTKVASPLFKATFKSLDEKTKGLFVDFPVLS